MSKISSIEIQLSSAFSSNYFNFSLLMGITTGSGRLLSNGVGDGEGFVFGVGLGLGIRVGGGRPDLLLVGGLFSLSCSN